MDNDAFTDDLEGTDHHPVLIACSHGTDNPQGRAVVSHLVGQVRELLPDIEVLETYVDVQYPQVDEVVASVAPGRGVVVVPLLLSGGFHVNVDIASAVRSRVSTGSPTVAASPLGPDPRLASILVDRLDSAGALPGDAVVVAAAGSSDAAAAADVEQVAADVAESWEGPVSIGYAASATPRVAVATDLARSALGGAEHGRVAMATYLLAPGFFSNRLAEAGADIVAEPLGAHPLIAQIIVDRFNEALTQLPAAV
ncbi:Sirohydrochlorin ferrochelatase [Sanguibacter gelidistatuariae]|uniref:Sirohydrochlorin ferrochelatase n=1 Tax=Sanguibacter gelidistatuariae TaxID=1814289 RepID=A0A1G6KQG0_9MICO|nr:CbiX/SirB N-terminal domain-containing protein [Sanguibacter gelidistatuariae]SDC33137.1 Sirohydrochlorin ferrochelatase [Sanguibacter gelidistatuariae]